MKWFRRTKPNRRLAQEETRSRRGVLAGVLAVLVVAVAGTGISMYLRNIEWERFRTLEVSGELNRVDADDVHAVLQPYLAEGFAGIDLHAARLALEAQPWIAGATMRREWPGTLAVELREEKPVATWFGTALMNEQGEVFVDGAAGFSGVLPDIGGPAGTQQDMIGRLAEIRAVMETRQLELRRLLRTERRAERFWLDNGIEVRLGRHDADARLRRFLDVAWPTLQARAERIKYVDMRYTNGFAVGWRTAGPNGEAGGEKG